MKRFINFALVLLGVLALTDLGFSQETPPSSPSSQNKIPIDVTAEHVVQDGEKDVVRAWGNVVVRYQDRVLRADKVQIDNKSGMGEAMGNVVVTQTDGTEIHSERSRFNTKSQKGKAYGIQGRIAQVYRVKAKEAMRMSPTHYKFKDSSLTTCSGKLPKWSFGSSKLDLVVGDRALFTGGVFRVLDFPIMYLPIGYLPINRERKSGFLIPQFGLSNTDGFTFKPIYYWAINRWSDATVGVEYLQKRGVRPELEYRYTPSRYTYGEFNGTFLDDRITGGQFWKVDWRHEQRKLPLGFKFKGKLDLESDNSFNKTFEDDTNLRTRRNSDSFASLNRSWSNSTFDILTRYRDSTQDDRDDLFAQLPQVTFNTQRRPIGNSNFYFNQNATFSSFLIDLNTSPINDDNFSVQRFDFHPQLSRPISLAPWLTLTPTVGWRETIYSKGLRTGNERTSSFTRELFDVSAALEGPKFNRVYAGRRLGNSKIKHVIEPRLVYSYIPAIDLDDRRKIRNIDGIDDIDSQSRFTYSLTQRLLRKYSLSDDDFSIREIMRFEISHSYDIGEATRNPRAGTELRPFSDIRMDFDSRLFKPLLLNFDSTFDVEDGKFNTFNFEVGIKPWKNVSFFVERRFARNSVQNLISNNALVEVNTEQTQFLTGSLFWAFARGWQVQATTRYDELRKTFRENDFSISFDDHCECWGFAFDLIQRNIISGGVDQSETKFLLSFTLRGIGTEKFGKRDIQHIHRRF